MSEGNKIAAALLACEASRQQQELVKAGPGSPPRRQGRSTPNCGRISKGFSIGWSVATTAGAADRRRRRNFRPD